MKKIFFVFLCIMFLPIMANAKEKCTVVSGNKTDIGSEIACGSEHFYIVDSNEKEVKMLDKYNLDVGISVHKEKIEKASDDTRTDEDYCNDLAIEKGGQAGASVAEGYCFYFTYADFSNVKQREDAKSAHVDENEEYLFPQIGNVYPSLYFSAYSPTFDPGFVLDFKIPKLIGNTNSSVSYEDVLRLFKDSKYDNYFADLEPNLVEEVENQYNSYSVVNAPSKYMNELGASLYYYKNNMSDYNINDVTLLTLEDLNNIATKRGKSLSYQEMYEAVGQLGLDGSPFKKLASLKEHVDVEDSWLYDRSYWLKTAYNYEESINSSNYQLTPFGLLFVNNLGDICGAAGMSEGIPGCQVIIRVAVGSGVRPVITMAPEDIYEPPKPIVNPETGSITVLVLVGLCGLLFIGRKSLKRFS